jgi:hypothetical protein
MTTLAEVVRKPAGVSAGADFAPWFAAVADHLLNRTDLVVNGAPYRMAEVEAYYHGPGHADPFGHRDPVQVHMGRWYFHRTAGVYRGGSFKGLDFAFGSPGVFVGFLIRTVVAPDGTFVVGPSLTVDHVLAKTGATSPAELDARIGTRTVWDETSPLRVRESPQPRAQAGYATARVGLSLKRARGEPDMPAFLMRPYRYLTEPRIAKGKPQTVIALHQRGGTPDAIRELTGSPRRSVEAYLAAYTAGLSSTDFGPYIGKDLSTGELCRLIGTWATVYGVPKSSPV